MRPDQLTLLKLEPLWWEEREARLSAREEPPLRATAPSARPRDAKTVAVEWIARLEAKFRAGAELDQADRAYALVLALRHGLALADDFEHTLRAALGWRVNRSPGPAFSLRCSASEAACV